MRKDLRFGLSIGCALSVPMASVNGRYSTGEISGARLPERVLAVSRLLRGGPKSREASTQGSSLPIVVLGTHSSIRSRVRVLPAHAGASMGLLGIF